MTKARGTKTTTKRVTATKKTIITSTRTAFVTALARRNDANTVIESAPSEFSSLNKVSLAHEEALYSEQGLEANSAALSFQAPLMSCLPKLGCLRQDHRQQNEFLLP